MSTMVVVRYEARAETAVENRYLVRQVFAELDRERPAGLRYATFRLGDGVTFVHVAVVEGATNPLPGLSAFSRFQDGIAERLVAPPEVAEATLVGSYRFLTA